MEEKTFNRGWIVTAAGLGINLALGVLYTWSVIKSAIPESWGWSAAQKSDPYAVACFVFAIAMIFAGRLQDRIGPRWVATIGGVLTGLGCLIAGLMGSSYGGFVFGFGIMAGIGIGFGYAAATPAAVKWFPPAKTGLIAGLVVAGFGLASAYIAPLANYLLNTFAVDNSGLLEKGVSATMVFFGVAFLIVVVVLAQFLRNPPEGYSPAREAPEPDLKAAAPKQAVEAVDISWKEMICTAQFWVLWTMYACGAAAGLMVIGSASALGKASLGEAAFLVVAVLAIGNASGRVLAGAVSDKIGRQWTMFCAYVLQSIIVLSLLLVQDQAVMLLIIAAVAGANYGANLSLFPSATKDYFGLKGLGLNYGIMFTAWGVGGLVLPRIAGMAKDATGSENLAFYIAAVLMILAATLTFVSRGLGGKSVQTIKKG